MFEEINKYRHLVFALLLLSYIFSVFQKPIFEGLHLLSHTTSIFLEGEKIHSYQSHDGQSHQHQNLSKLEVLGHETDRHPFSQNDQEVKKKVEIVDKSFEHSQEIVTQSLNYFRYNLPNYTAFLKIPNPPPQLSS